MARIDIRASLSGDITGKLRRMLAFAGKPFAGSTGREVVKAARSVIMSEFSRGGHERPSGGFAPWPKGHDFGDKKAPPVPLGGVNGRLARAWNGGTGGFERISHESITIGVDLIYARVHRGPDSNPVAGRITLIKPRHGQKMRYFLGLNMSAWLKESTLRAGLKVPSRPHATNNPKTQAAVSELVAKALATA